MPRKRARIPVVFDTNLFVTRFIKHDRHGINRRVMDLWQSQRKLQLISVVRVADVPLDVVEDSHNLTFTLLMINPTSYILSRFGRPRP